MSAINPIKHPSFHITPERGLTEEEKAEVVELGKTLGIEEPFDASAREIQDIRDANPRNEDILCKASRLENLLIKNDDIGYLEPPPCTIQ